ncbi:MAG: aspartate aminotransferase family protein [Bacteroidia bacterium]
MPTGVYLCIMLEDLYYRHIAQTSDESIALPVERAEGVWLYGPSGQRWLDLISGICVNNVGHGAPEVLAAIARQSAAYLHPMVYGEVIMAPQVHYAARLTGLLGHGLDTVYFTNSGAEAVEGALKVAKKYTGRQGLVAFGQAYHGSTHGAMSVSGIAGAAEGYGPGLPGVQHLPFNDVEALARIDEQTAAVIVEAIQAGGGLVLPAPGYLAALRARCDEVGALLILDEIQTGMGRTGTLFAHEALGPRPDILLLAKALGGGLPLGAFIGRAGIMDVIRRDPPLGYITTYGGHPLSCAAGLAALDKLLGERLLERVPALEQILLERLHHPLVAGCRGRGLFYALLFDDAATAEAVRQAALRLGVITIGFLGINNGLRICPPLTIAPEELHLACDILIAAMDEVLAARQTA